MNKCCEKLSKTKKEKHMKIKKHHEQSQKTQTNHKNYEKSWNSKKIQEQIMKTRENNEKSRKIISPSGDAYVKSV